MACGTCASASTTLARISWVLRPHFLLDGDGGGAAHFRLRLGDALVGIGLFGLQFGADVFAHVHVGDVDGENLKRGAAIEAFGQNGLGNAVGIFQHFFVGGGRADGADDAFADARDDRFLGGAADEAIEIRAHRDARLTLTPMPSLATPSMVVAPMDGIGRIDDFRIDAGADGFEDGLAGAFGGEVDGAGAIEVERDAGFVRGDEGEDDVADIAAGQVMRLQRIGGDVEAGFDRGDAVVDDQADRDFAQAHADHLADADGRVGDPGPKPEAKEVK